MKNSTALILSTAVCLFAVVSTAPAQPGGAGAGKIQRLEIYISSGEAQKDVTSRLYLLVSRRVGTGGATVGQTHLLFTKGYEYHPGDKWGPKEGKEFRVMLAQEPISREDFGGLALVNAMDKPNESDLEVNWIHIVGVDQAGHRWLLADYKPTTNATERRWLRSDPAAGDSPVLPIPTLEWKEAPPAAGK